MRTLPCLALAALTAFAQPRIFYSDLDSGPRGGGESGQGAFVTIYGAGFGASRFNATVSIGGGAAAAYPVWTDNKVTFQLGGNAVSGDIRLTNSAGTSNAVPFTVRGGNIYFVGPNGADSNPGSFTSPWRTIQKAVDAIAPGDIVYALNGATAIRGGTSDGSVTLSRNHGAAGSPKALVAYPGAVASIGQTAGGPCVSTACIEGLRTTFASDYWTIAGLRLAGNDYALAIRGRGWRVVGNDLTCPFGSGARACLDASQSTLIKVYGNDVHDAGYSQSSDLYHGVYFSTDSNNIDIGWNTIRNIQGCRGLQFNSTALDANTGFNQYSLSIHDNYISGTQCDGIVFSTVDPSQGAITVYNNVIADAGRGPRTFEGGGTFSCIYAAGYRGSRSGPGSGTIDIFHNTLYNCGSFASVNGYGGITYARRDTTIDVRVRNNIIVHTNGSPYWVNYDSAEGLTGSNNLVFGNGAPASVGPFGTIVADPFFLNPAAGDFRIAANSPARAAGLNTGLATDKDGVTRGAAPDIGAYQAGAGSGTPIGGTPIGGTPVLAISTGGIDVAATQGTNPAAQSFTVANIGSGSLSYVITSTAGWVQPSPTSSSIPAGSSQTISLTFAATALPVGLNTATVRVSGAGTDRDIAIRLTVNPAGGAQSVLSSSAISLDFNTADPQDPPPSQTFILRNAGTPGAVASWTSRANAAWLALEPNAGFATTAGQSVRVVVNPSGLSVGSYATVLTLLSDTALNSPLQIPVTLTIGAVTGGNFALAVTPAALDVAVTAGVNPDARTIAVTNTSQQALDANASADQPWLQAISGGGFGFLLPGASQTVSVTFNAVALSAGVYTANVRIGSGIGARSLPVRLTVNPVVAAPPGLSVDQAAFNFVTADASEAPAPQVVRLRHGGGNVNWFSSTDQAWLQLGPNAGQVNAAGQEIRLNVNPSGLSPGTHTATARLEASGALNSPQLVTVRLTVGGAGAGSLSVSPPALEVTGDQGSDAPAQTLFVSNTGAAASFTATAEPTWLRISPGAGFLSAGSSQALTVSLASASLTPGVYAGLVRITGAGVTRDVTVRLTVNTAGQQRLAVSTDSFNFAVLDPNSDPPLPQAFRLRNAGSGSMNWSSRSSQAWVSLSPNAGTVNSLGQDVSVIVNPSGLTAGTNVATITLTGSSGAPVQLTVRLSLGGSADGGVLSVGPLALEVAAAAGSGTPPQTVLLRNNGSQSLSFSAAADQAWILVSPASGSLPPGSGQSLTVNLNTSALGAGTHLGSIRIEGGGVERVVAVRVTVGSGGGGSAGGVTLSTDALQFDYRLGSEDPPPAQTIRLTNATNQPISWSGQPDQAWVSLSPNGGYLTPGSQTIGVVLNPSGLPGGTHTASVTIRIGDTGATLRLTVRSTVTQ